MSSLEYLADLTQCLTELLGKECCIYLFKKKHQFFPGHYVLRCFHRCMLFQMAFMAFHTFDCCLFATGYHYYSTLHHIFSFIHLQTAQVNSLL